MFLHKYQQKSYTWVLHKTYKSATHVRLRLDVSIGELRIELAWIPNQWGNWNDTTTNSPVWLSSELALQMPMRFQYQIMFGWQTLELHSYITRLYLFYMTQNWNLTTNKYIATKINKYSRNVSGKCKMVIHGQQYIACFLHSIIIAVLLLSRISGTEHVLQFILPTGSEYLYLWILFRKA